MKLARKYGFNNDEDALEDVRTMILVGLEYDFFCEGGKLLGKELEVKLEGKNYLLTGYIDQLWEKDGTVEIRDFKSQKKKIPGKELDSSVQGLAYSLAVKRIYNMNSVVKFILLKFPNTPLQECRFTNTQINNFNDYLEYLGDFLRDYSTVKAGSDMAAGDYGRSWLCGKDIPGKFICSARKPFNYFILYNKDGKIKRTAFKEEDLVPKDGEFVMENYYEGCPYYNSPSKSTETLEL